MQGHKTIIVLTGFFFSFPLMSSPFQYTDDFGNVLHLSWILHFIFQIAAVSAVNQNLSRVLNTPLCFYRLTFIPIDDYHIHYFITFPTRFCKF